MVDTYYCYLFDSFFSANLGGVLGMCTGFSLLTAVELLYWFTVRLVSDYFGKNKISVKSSQDNEQNTESQSEKEGDMKNKNENEMNKLETKIVEIESSFGKTDTKITKLETKIVEIETSCGKIDTKITKMETQMAKMLDEIEGIRDMLKTRRFRSVADSK